MTKNLTNLSVPCEFKIEFWRGGGGGGERDGAARVVNPTDPRWRLAQGCGRSGLIARDSCQLPPGCQRGPGRER